ncbi:MAG: MFS transporter [Caldilinea sp.]|nr:MFS transporter [Caldilinea sp.]MDW8440827.1 MFS transporter [Caldilineaceae bacterium]
MERVSSLLTRPIIHSGAPSTRLWVAKLYYFAFFAAIGALAPFFNIHLSNQGLSGAQIGLLGSIPPIIALLANPFWGAIADRWQIHQQVLALCALGAGLLTLPFLWVSGFWPLLLLVILMIFFRAPVPSLLDSAVIDMAARTGAGYGRQRLFGSIGFVAFSYGLGRLLSPRDMDAIFWLHGLLLAVVCAGLSLLLPIERLASRPKLLSGLAQLWRQPGYPNFLLMNVLMGAGAASFIGFIGLHLLALGGSEAEVGMVYALNAVTEIPILFIGSLLLARVRTKALIAIGLVGFAAVYIVMALSPAPIYILSVAPLLGVLYASFWMAVVDYAAQSAPAGLRATGQALVGAAQGGLGWAIGAIVGGLLWDVSGGSAVLWGAAALMLLAALVYVQASPLSFRMRR